MFKKHPSPTPMGFVFGGNLQMENGSFEPTETGHILKLFDSTDSLINVGANVGYYCCLALKHGKKVVAFEPMLTNQRHLYRNVHANGWGDLFECYPIALSDTGGLLEIFGDGTGASLIKGWAGQQDATIVPVSTLDQVLGERFSEVRPLIIVDIEGAEYGMLLGATKLLNARVKPIWFVEISVSEHQPKGIAVNPNLLKTFELFFNTGYVAISADNNPRFISLAEIKKIEETRVDTVKMHNFIFVEGAMKDKILDHMRVEQSPRPTVN